MAKVNLTVQLDEETIRSARIVAAKRGTSVSALVAMELAALVDDDARYEDARIRAEQILVGSVARGGPAWWRDDIHDRADRG